MARRTDGGVRFRPVGSSRHPRTPVRYSPGGTGCPAIEQAIEQLYHGQNEESFWALMGALNYALELETHVLVPLQTAPGTPPTPAPWAENPVPQQKARGLALWTLKNKDRTWLPLFTSSAAACVDRSTAARPMADYTLQDAMELVLDAPDIDGVVIDPWGHSATLDEALLNGLLHAGHNPEEPGDEEVEAGREAARAGDWRMAADHYDEAAQQGNAMGLSLLADCLYRGEAGKALLYYRKARQTAQGMPDIEYTPRICLRLAQAETRYVSAKKAMALAAEAAQGFAILAREKEPDAAELQAEAEQLLRELTDPKPRNTAYNIDSLQLD